MKITELTAVDPGQLSVRLRSAVKYRPKSAGMNIRFRKCSSFLYVAAGSYRYISASGQPWELTVHEGCAVYLPAGACYTYEVADISAAECYQIDFDAFICGAETAFTDTPELIAVPAYTADAIFAGICAESGNTLTAVSGIYRLLGLLANSAQRFALTRGLQRIRPAVEYIQANYRDSLCAAELAAMCYLSESQLRRIFAAELGVSPTGYRTSVRMKAAARMLSGSYESIAAVAEAVGYDTAAAFSKAFREAYGKPPREWAEDSYAD